LEARQRGRGPFGSAEHRAKRQRVHDDVFRCVQAALARGQRVVIDATVHEAPPEAFEEYRTFFDEQGILWQLRILHPALEVAVERDARRSRSLGAHQVAQLHAKFSGKTFPAQWFLDTSHQSPEETVAALLHNDAA
jgi:predicted kinase